MGDNVSAVLCKRRELREVSRNARATANGIIDKHSQKHKNVSKRTLETYRDYCTDELRELVATRDRFFIDLFGYTFLNLPPN